MKKLIHKTDVENGLFHQEDVFEISAEFFYSKSFKKMSITAKYLYLVIANRCDVDNTKIISIDTIDFKQCIECSQEESKKYLQELENNDLILCVGNEIHLKEEHTRKAITEKKATDTQK